MSYRVCIPTAGTGSRLGSLTQYLNKSLVSVANRPVLSHVIDQFPDDTEFVIALGHKGNLIREFLELAYPSRTFHFGKVFPFEGTGSGLGLSLLACKQFLQQPFIFISCDTLVGEIIPPPADNWAAYAEVSNLAPYRTLRVEAGRVTEIAEKGVGRRITHKAYIGLAGVHDYTEFWHAMDEGGSEAVNAGEAYGLRALTPKGIRGLEFSWDDTGSPAGLARARAAHTRPGMPNILEKANEAIWFVNGNVIKFSDDAGFIANRAARAKELAGFVPEVTGVTSHMYRYSEAEGEVMSDAANVPLFEKLLGHSQAFWRPQSLSPGEDAAFRSACMNFYRDKTRERINRFFADFDRKDGTESINGVPMPSMESLLGDLDWDWLSAGSPGRFHGDFHFENILWRERDEKFTFLDWRQDFGGSLTTGDIYYDLAKLLHGLIVNHEIVAQNRFAVEWTGGKIDFSIERKPVLVECEEFFGKWLERNNYGVRKVRVLTALVYLNIAALHHYPYSLLLFALGKSMLVEEMNAR